MRLLKHGLAPARAGGIEIIDLLRTTMCVAIIVLHCRELFPPGSAFDLHTQCFRYFTDVFFIMSGYLLALRPQSRPHGTFLLSRIVRLYPLHLVTFLVCLVLALLRFRFGDGQPVPLQTAAAHVTLTHALGLADRAYQFNGPSWSISALFLCYLLLPVLTKVLHRGLWQGLAGVAVLFLFGIEACDGQVFRAADAGWGALRCLPDFAFGLVLARTRPRLSQIVSLTLAGACVALAVLLGELQHNSLSMILVYVFFTAIHALQQTGFRPPAWTRPLTRFAPYSLGIFMLHYPVMRIAGHLPPREAMLANPWIGLAMTACIVVASLLLAVVSHHAFEMPVAAWLNARLRARTAPAGAAAWRPTAGLAEVR